MISICQLKQIKKKSREKESTKYITIYQVGHPNSFHPYLRQNHLEETNSQEPEED